MQVWGRMEIYIFFFFFNTCDMEERVNRWEKVLRSYISSLIKFKLNYNQELVEVDLWYRLWNSLSNDLLMQNKIFHRTGLNKGQVGQVMQACVGQTCSFAAVGELLKYPSV